MLNNEKLRWKNSPTIRALTDNHAGESHVVRQAGQVHHGLEYVCRSPPPPAGPGEAAPGGGSQLQPSSSHHPALSLCAPSRLLQSSCPRPPLGSGAHTPTVRGPCQDWPEKTRTQARGQCELWKRLRPAGQSLAAPGTWPRSAGTVSKKRVSLALQFLRPLCRGAVGEPGQLFSQAEPQAGVPGDSNGNAM